MAEAGHALRHAGPPTAAPAWNVRIGLVVAVSVLLAVLAAIAQGLPEPWWAAITAWRVVDLRPEASLARGVQRCVGTLAGAAFGFIASGLVVASPVLQAMLLFATAGIATWQRFASATWSYGWTLGGMTAVMVLVQGLYEPSGLYAFAQARVQEILCGVVVASAVVLLLSERTAGHLPAAPPARPDQSGLKEVALLTATAVLAVVLLWDVFDLPALVQIVICVLVVVDRDVIVLRRRGGQRLLGCLVGGGYGVAMIGIGVDSALPWSMAVAGGVFLCSRLALGGGANAYAGVQGGMAVLTALIVGDGPPTTLEPVLDRLAGIFIGVALILVLSAIFTPRHPAPAAQ